MQSHHLSKHPIGFNEFRIGTTFDNFTLMRDKCTVRLRNSRKPVGNHQDSSPVHQFIQGILDEFL